MLFDIKRRAEALLCFLCVLFYDYDTGSTGSTSTSRLVSVVNSPTTTRTITLSSGHATTCQPYVTSAIFGLPTHSWCYHSTGNNCVTARCSVVYFVNYINPVVSRGVST